MVSNPFLLRVNRLESILTEEVKRRAFIVSLYEEHTDSEIAIFLKFGKSFVF